MMIRLLNQKYVMQIFSLIVFFVLFLMYLRLSWTFPSNSDTASYILQAQSILHGNIFLTHWTLSADNFWTIDIPFYVAAVFLRGVIPSIAHDVPALMYAMLVVSSVFLASKVGRGKIRIVSGAVVFLLIGLPAPLLAQIISIGPIHIGTILFVTITFLALDKIETGNNRLAHFVFFLFMLLALIGDPLALWIGAIPILLVSALRIIRAADKKKWINILALNILSVVISKAFLLLVQHFGGLNTVPITEQFVSMSQWPANFYLTLKGILSLFGADFFGLQVKSFNTAVVLIHLLGLIFVTYALYYAWKKRGYVSDGVSAVLAASILLDLSAYLFSTQPVNIMTSRYLVPSMFFSAILAGRNAPLFMRGKANWLLGGIGGVFVLSFLPLVFSPIQGAPTESLGKWLVSHRLYSGYGSYWDASITTVSSGGVVKVIPVAFAQGKIVPFDWLSNSLWYARPADFLVFDSSNWGNVNIKTAEQTFGIPKSIHAVDGFTVMVWARNISASLG